VSGVAAHAPGKLFLTGEWAVLDGAPALVAAIDRRAHVHVTPTSGPLVVESRAEERTVTAARPADGPLPGGDVGAVLAAWRAVGSTAGGHVTVDSRAFLTGDRKLGLGRSAATLAAATAALLPTATRDHLLATALAANALFQDGRGSGGDVAAAIHGGVVEVRREGEGLLVERRVLPAGLTLLVGWTGEPAPTTPLLDRFATAARPPVLRDLAGVATRAARAFEASDVRVFLDAVEASAVLLAALGDATGLPLVTPALARLVAAAKRAGVAAKPSGAGAGDCGIAFATTPAEATSVRTAWQAEGITPLDVTITMEGAARG
jgi:phosphomevalonate kinase